MITNRRALLVQLAGAIGAAAIPQIARAGVSAPCEQSQAGPYAGYFPNVVVLSVLPLHGATR